MKNDHYKFYNSTIIISFLVTSVILLISINKRFSIFLLIFLVCLLIFLFFLYLTLMKKYLFSLFNSLNELVKLFFEKNEESDNSLSRSSVLLLNHKLKKMIHLYGTDIKDTAMRNKKTENLISEISHQMKTPISNLVIFSELLRENVNHNLADEDSKNIEYVDTIINQTHKLKWLIQSLVQSSRFENDIITFNKRKTNLKHVILSAMKEVQVVSENKNIQINYLSQSNLYVTIDTRWTKEALINILENSIKYSKNGEIIITISTVGYLYRIDIIDYGIGISENDIPKIFDKFYRGQYTENYSGAGIGLYIAREIIELQGGHINVVSKIAEGSTFQVYLQR